jgi:hypothetical protein
VEPLDETSTMSTEQVRQDSFIRALEMVNLIISRNPEILAYYWYLWTCRVRTYSDSLPAEKMTCSMVKQMPVPTEEQQLLLKQKMKQLVVIVYNKKLVINGEILYAFTDTAIEPADIFISHHVFDVANYNMRLLFISEVILHELVHVFEPIHVNLQKDHRLFCQVFTAQGSPSRHGNNI